jgi:adenosylmethionine-8-amino-7-oxononanoate aminotransferase
MTIAKGLGGGYEPIGAVLLGGHIYESFANGSGFFQHGHTYMGHPMACAAGLAVQETIRRDNLLANVRTQGALLRRRLSERFGNHPHVGDIRGRGLFQAIELVEERSTKTPFDPARSSCRGQEGRHGARPDGLSDGRHDRRHAGRPRAAGPALHRD